MDAHVEEPQSKLKKRTRLLRQFSDPSFHDILVHLLDWAEGKMRRKSWMGVFDGPAPGAKDAADVVYDVLNKIFQNDDELGPDTGVPLEKWLWDKVSSTISNFVRSYENRNRSRNHAPGMDPIYGDGGDYSKEEKTPATIAAKVEWDRIVGENLSKFAQTLSDDLEVAALFECLKAGFTKREEIGEYLEIAPAEVTVISRRLDRRMSKYSTQNQESNPFKA